MNELLESIGLGILTGTIGRAYMLRVDYRQYPNYPHEYIIHLTMGLVAAALGAVAIPAIVAKDFVAVTFLAIATQQFREVRNMERETLNKLEATELVPRGSAYIEGIAKVFEARNYLAMLTALVVSGIFMSLGNLQIILKIAISIVSAIILLCILNKKVAGPVIGDICHVRAGEILFEGSLLKVEDVVIMNIGLKESREKYINQGLAAIIEPKDDNARATINTFGQRKAIVHDVSIMLGTKVDVSERDLVPLARIDLKTGRIIVTIVPMEKDIECLLEAIRIVPVLESSTKKPLKSGPGYGASD